MPGHDPHPLNELVERFEGVHVVTDADLQRLRPGEELNVSVIFLVSDGAPLFIDLTLAPVSDGIRLDLTPSLRSAGYRLPALIGVKIHDGALPAYSVGMERCHCPPEEGGPLWNPLTVALTWAPALDVAARGWVALGWLEMVQTKQHLFCRGGIATLCALGVV